MICIISINYNKTLKDIYNKKIAFLIVLIDFKTFDKPYDYDNLIHDNINIPYMEFCSIMQLRYY